MKLKTADLEGYVLNWASACADGNELDWGAREYRKWDVAGPIIDRERITLDYAVHGQETVLWTARQYAFDGTCLNTESGPTPLIAALRVFVASELGDEVDVPDELMEQSELDGNERIPRPKE